LRVDEHVLSSGGSSSNESDSSTISKTSDNTEAKSVVSEESNGLVGFIIEPVVVSAHSSEVSDSVSKYDFLGSCEDQEFGVSLES